MDAPLITLDDPANTTDVYAFRSQSEDGQTQYLTTALAVYPFEEPGIGPNAYRFDDRVPPAHRVADDDAIRRGIELGHVPTLGELNIQALQLGAHRRVDIGIATRDSMAGGLGQRRYAAHEGATDSEYVYVHG